MRISRLSIKSSLMALALAVLLPGNFSLGADPRYDGVIPRVPAEADPNIFADPKTIKTPGGRPVTPPTPVAATKSGTPVTTGTGTSSAPSPETGPAPDLGPADTNPYPIKLDRAAAGMSYDTQIVAEQTTTNSHLAPGAAAPMVEGTSMKVELAGRVAIATLLPTGEPAEFTVTVTKFNVDGKEAVAATKVITITHADKKWSYQIGGQAVDDTTRDGLGLAFGKEDLSNLGTDAIFGTKSQHKAGESWKLDADASAKELEKPGKLTVDPKNVTGEATLKGVELADGAKALRLEATLTAHDMKMSDPTIIVEGADSKAEIKWLLPADSAMMPIEKSEIMDETVHATSPQKVDTTIHTSRKETITPVK